MKLPLICAKCMQENIVKPRITAIVELKDDGRYEITCRKGHSSITFCNNKSLKYFWYWRLRNRWWVLSRSGFVIYFCFRKILRVFIKVVCISKNIDWIKTLEAWKEVSNQSERQLGAFIFLHLQETGNKPILLCNNKIKLRNEVIHKGKIPSKDQSIDYGQAILDVVRPLLKNSKKITAMP